MIGTGATAMRSSRADLTRCSVARAALDFVGLGNRANETIPSFSYGHQRLIEIARALAANPTVLLLRCGWIAPWKKPTIEDGGHARPRRGTSGAASRRAHPSRCFRDDCRPQQGLYVGNRNELQGCADFLQSRHARLRRQRDRTCGSPASGSRTRPHDFVHDTSCPSRLRRTSPKYP